MAIISRDELKNAFKNGKKPTEIEFANWIDSYIHWSDELTKWLGKFAETNDARQGKRIDGYMNPFLTKEAIINLTKLKNIPELEKEVNALITKLINLTKLKDIPNVNEEVNALIKSEIDKLIADAPETLNTLKEIADKLKNDDDAITAIVKQIDTKEPKIDPKLTAFNKDFGTATDQVARGDHNHDEVYASYDRSVHTVEVVRGGTANYGAIIPVAIASEFSCYSSFNVVASEVGYNSQRFQFHVAHVKTETPWIKIDYSIFSGGITKEPGCGGYPVLGIGMEYSINSKYLDYLRVYLIMGGYATPRFGPTNPKFFIDVTQQQGKETMKLQKYSSNHVYEITQNKGENRSEYIYGYYSQDSLQKAPSYCSVTYGTTTEVTGRRDYEQKGSSNVPMEYINIGEKNTPPYVRIPYRKFSFHSLNS